VLMIIIKGGLTIVPIVPWHAPRRHVSPDLDTFWHHRARWRIHEAARYRI